MTKEKKRRFTKRSLPEEIRLAIQAGLAKKAEDLCVLDLRELASFTDYFLITHGNSSRQNIAISDALEAELKTAGYKPMGIMGKETADWILMDYGYFIVHVFSRKAREFYALEKLWGDAPRLDF